MRTIVDMGVQQKPQVTLSAADREALDLLIAETGWIVGKEAAPLIRMLMRIGLRVYAADPLAAKRLDSVPPQDWLVEKMREANARDKSMGTTTFNLGMGVVAPEAAKPEPPPPPPEPSVRMPPTAPTKRPPAGAPRDRGPRGRSGSRGDQD